jgi:hypothetical protein
MSNTPQSPRGWYPDPQLAGRDRWWDGEAWTSFTHRTAGAMSAGPRYTRSYWVGPNLAAGRSRIFAYLGTLLLLAAIVFFTIAALPSTSIPNSTLVNLVLFALAGVAHGLAIGFGASALRQAPVLGARGLALSNIIVGSIEGGICAIAVLVAALFLAFGGGN